MNIYQVFTDKLITPLKEITQSSGYDNDVTVLEGWITQYADDIQSKDLFPVVVVRPDVENCNTTYVDIGASKHTDNQAMRSYHVMGAVSLIKSPSTYLARLESLLLDVKRSLSDTRFVTLEKVEFDIPQNGIGYATFELTIKLTINEKLEKPKP